MDDLVRAARIVDATRQTLGHPQPLFHLGQGQNAAVDDSMPPSKRATTDLPPTKNRSAAAQDRSW
ncbi:hypothetical protein X751_00270 [Mesorhizobium sp. LNJC395A00]|nr:hypothetical protein X751_00270 [Mesorhizobium sp. LNJC395A00]